MSERIDEPQAGHGPTPKPRRLLRACLWMSFGALITVTVLSGTVAMLFNILEQRPQYIADWLSQQSGRSISLRALELSWNDGAPLLRLNGLKVQASGLQAGGLALERSEIRFDAIKSLREGSPQLSKITVHGADIHLRQGEDDQWMVAGLGSQGGHRADAVIGQALAAIPPGAEFRLENASLSIEGVLDNNPRGAELKFQPVSLNLRNIAQSPRLSGAIGLPGLQQQPLRFSLRWPQGAGTPIRQSKLALIATQLPLSRIPWVAGLLELDALDGVLDLTLDVGIRDGAVTTAAGRLELRQLALSLGQEWPALQLDTLRSVVDYARIPKGWRLSLLKLVIEHQQQTWPQTTLSLTRINDKLIHHDRMALDQLPIAAVVPLLKHAPLPVDLRDHLTAGLNHLGQLENIELTRTQQPAEQSSATMSLDFRDVSYRDPASGIRVGAARGSMTLLDRGGRLRIETARFHLPENPRSQQRPPITARGDLRWHHAGNQLILDLDDLQLSDGTVRFDTLGRIRLPTATQNASLDLHARVSDVSTDDLKPYLDLRFVSPVVAEWISQSLSGGRFSHLQADLSGELLSLDDLATRATFSGRFQNVDLDYAKGWPKLNRLEGQLKLVAKRLRFTIRKGDVAGARIQNASGLIADVSQQEPVIRITGKIRGRSEQAGKFINASPLKSRFSGLLNNLELTGPADLKLELDIPLSDDPVAVRGTLHMRDNQIQVPVLRTGLKEVQGQLSFDTKGPKQGHFNAQYLAKPIRLDLDGNIDNGAITRLTIGGRTNPAGLVQHLYNLGAINSNLIETQPLFTRLAGETDWHVALDIPIQWATGTRLGLRVESDLLGMALDLPAPLGKAQDERRILSIRTHITELSTRRFNIEYGERMNAVLEVKLDGLHYRLSRGEIILGTSRAILPALEGMGVTGSLAYLSVDEWVNLLSQYQNTESTPITAQRARPMAEVRTIRLHAQALDALGSRFNNVRLEVLHETPTGWKIGLNGSGLEGTIVIHEPLSDSGIQARFQRLSIQPSPRNIPTADIDPRSLPPLNLIVDELRYKDLELGLFKLILQPFDQGTRIQQLFALNDAFEIRGRGDWLRRDGNTRSALRLQANGNDFGKLLAAIGYPETGVDGGAVDMLIEGKWPGSPFDFDTTTLQGTLHFRASNGFLRDIEHGVTGRVFGLFTLTTLPRRLLRLDFSDLFEEGLGYNLLEGSFDLEAGNAYTNNLILDTDTSRVEIVGRVGLILRDYDQVMTVTPKLSSSLPLAPLWLAEKLLNTNLINDVFSYRYTVTGSWDKPKVERIRVEIPEFELK